MSQEKTKKSNNTLVLSLILLLLAVGGFQTWYIVNMQKQLDSMQSNTNTVQNKPLSTASSVTPDVTVKKEQNTTNVHAKKKQETTTAIKPVPNHMTSLFNNDFFTQSNNGQAWNPYEDIQRMQQEMDRLFNHTYNRFKQSPDGQQLLNQGVSAPQMDVKEDDNQYTIIVDLPGADEKNIAVDLDDQLLTVKGEQDFSNEHKDAGGNVVFQERRTGSFQRSITLPEPVKQAGMNSHVSNGVLTITIPKA